MGKFSRLIIILFVFGLCAWLIYPSINWYFIMPQEDKPIAETSIEQIEKKEKKIKAESSSLRRLLVLDHTFVWPNKQNPKFDIRLDTETIKFDLAYEDLDANILSEIKEPWMDAARKEAIKNIYNSAKADYELITKIYRLRAIKERTIKLGLDLAGGVELTLDVNIEKLKAQKIESEQYHYDVNARADYYFTEGNEEGKVNNARIEFFENNPQIPKDSTEGENAFKSFFIESVVTEEVQKKLNSLDADARRQAKEVLKQAEKVIGDRINKFGVSEPKIELDANGRILVQIPGGKDIDQTKKIVTKAGNLQFMIVNMDYRNKIFQEAIDKGINLEDGVPKSAVQDRVLNEALVNECISKGICSPLPSGTVLRPQFSTNNLGVKNQTGVVPLDTLRSLGKNEDIIQNSWWEYDTQAQSYKINFTIKEDKKKDFGALTRANIQNQMAILLDEEVKSAPTIQGAIDTGSGQITGRFSANEAEEIATILKAGILPGTLESVDELVIGPSLGEQNIIDGRDAAFLAMIVVAAFMILYYGFAGFVADIALVLNLFLVLSVLSGLGFTLTLPGIVGLVLTIGMAVDANVIIYERVREELRLGRAMEAALATGYSRAFSTIFDANITTMLAALVLSQIGTGSILKGFGMTLLWGILTSMFTSLFVTRFIFDLTYAIIPARFLSVWPVWPFSTLVGRKAN